VWKEPSENAQLLDAFDLDSTKDLPALVVFVEDSNGTVHSTSIKIDGTSEDTAYQTLKEALEGVSGTLEMMLDENRTVDTRAYELAAVRLQSIKNWRAMKRAVGVIGWFKSALGAS
jgi:hypothetical protein